MSFVISALTNAYFNFCQPPQNEKNSQKIFEKQITPIDPKEKAFSSDRYLAIAATIALIATLTLPLCFPVSIALFAVASWYLWSATVIQLNGVCEGTYLEKQIQHLHAIAMEVNSGVTAALVFPLTLFKSHHAPQGNLKGQPILMVNGYLSFGSTWYYQKKKLTEAGLGPIYTMNVGTGKSIETYAKEVAEKVQEIQKETGKQQIALIGHSKGGLVSSYYATHLATPETKVTDVITIGSPLAGTPIAYLGPGYDAYEMRSHSEFHKNLRDKISKCSQTRFSQIASEADEIVPLSSALLEGNHKQLIVKDMGHLGLVFSSRVAQQVCNWLPKE